MTDNNLRADVVRQGESWWEVKAATDALSGRLWSELEGSK